MAAGTRSGLDIPFHFTAFRKKAGVRLWNSIPESAAKRANATGGKVRFELATDCIQFCVFCQLG